MGSVAAAAPPHTNSHICPLQGFLAFLLGSDPRAAVLRSTITFVVVPMLNPDGVFLGNYR